MKKIEMEIKFAEEIYLLDEEIEELRVEMQDALDSADLDRAKRYRRMKSKEFAKRKQVFKMAELIGLDGNHIENMAFEIAVTKANQEPLGINLSECVPF